MTTRPHPLITYESQQKLKALQQEKRRKYSHLAHEIRTKHKISRKTLFYVKEYGKHSHVAMNIIRESIGVLLMASIISSIGGISIEQIRTLFVSLTPFVILLPNLNDMIGDYGTIVSSRFSTMLHEGKIKGKWWKHDEMQKLLAQIFIVSIITASFSVFVAVIVSGYAFQHNFLEITTKVLIVTLLDVLLLLGILVVTAVAAGIYFFKKGEDPNNLLIPLTTSVADFGNMLILAFLIKFLF